MFFSDGHGFHGRCLKNVIRKRHDATMEKSGVESSAGHYTKMDFPGSKIIKTNKNDWMSELKMVNKCNQMIGHITLDDYTPKKLPQLPPIQKSPP